MYFTPKADPRLFRCSCGREVCDAPTPNPALIEMLNVMRHLYGQPMAVTSGPRCRWYNEQEHGDPKSEHLYGDGADLACVSSRQRYQMLNAARLAGFKRVGIGADFLHVGISERPEHPPEVAWDYYPKRART
jgi:hypothetical protein